MQPGDVERDLFALHQVLHRDLANARGRAFAADDVVQRGHRHHRHPRAFADLHHAPSDLVRHRGHGDDRMAHVQALSESRQVVERAQDAHAVQQAPALLLVVVEETHDAPLVAARELFHEADRGVSGAHDDDLGALLAATAVERPLLEGAIRHAAGRHHRDEEQRVEDVLAVAELVVQAGVVQRDRDEHGPAHHREHDPLDVRQARVAPHTLVDAEEEVDRDLDRRGDGECGEEIARLGAGCALDVDQHGRQDDGEAEHHAVVQCRGERSSVRFDRFHRCSQSVPPKRHLRRFRPVFLVKPTEREVRSR